MERYMAHLLKGAEYRTRQFMGSQVKNPASLQYGGIKGDIWEAKRRSMPWLLPWLCISMRTAAFIRVRSCIRQWIWPLILLPEPRERTEALTIPPATLNQQQILPSVSNG